ncbi:hypothetical protein D3C84_727270 [compost metagenome]
MPFACHFGQNSLSALTMAVPPSLRPSKISLLAWNTPSREPKPSRWAAATLLMMAASGRAREVVQAISPGWLAPSSITANRC